MFTPDAFLVSNFFNISHMAGFETASPTERDAYLLLINDKKIIITDARYDGEKHSTDSQMYILQKGERVMDSLYRMCTERQVKTLGCEANDLKWSEVQALQKMKLQLVPIPYPFSQKRSIKTEEELFAIKQACHIGDMVLKDITPYIHPGQTEKEIAWFIEKSIREGYQAELAFDPIVAVDAHAAIAHYNTKKGEGVIQDGSILLIDFGVKAHNYCSDITRMVGIGTISEEIKKIYFHLLDVQKKTIEQIKTISELKDIDSFCRSELQKYSLPLYTHSTGHGIGLEVHEAPRINAVSTDEKKTGQVFTIEPGIYVPNKWGMRIEDTVTILDQGEGEVLTRFPKDLILV
ncbi:MAG: M24 family metallopeptidase [bacterium]